MKKKFMEQSFGVRFAAKEALLKAIGAGIFDYELNSVEVRNMENGKPVLCINNEEIIKKIKNLLNKDEFHIDISVSHEKEYSIAHVIIC
jgi:holo-[acyl-carrier-protein] synthase